jgi:exopolyphosphatase/guanosine-5'-triphosphate,3'-diphosphate pyrophosphatase
MQVYDTLAAVDLGSNSFRLQVVRVVDGQIYELDSLKETVRLAAGLDAAKTITESAQQTALDCLKRFGERLRGFPREAVRAVGTNSLRVAKNAKEFLVRAEEVLGFPIEIIAGREEARLIYVGVAHSLPASRERRLVVDIGGGSTECIIGTSLDPVCTESLYMGCVTHTLRYFPDGKINARRMQAAELAARAELQTIASEFSSAGYGEAIASSGTARTLGEMIAQNGFGEHAITPQGMVRLRAALIKAGDWRRLSMPGLPPDRAPVIVGGFAIMTAVVDELKIDRMSLSDYALRHGVLFDLIGRVHHEDMREATVQQFMRRYQVDPGQAKRVEHTALSLFEATAAVLPEIQREHAVQMLSWAARLHEIGISIAYSGYHKHSAYIAQGADMPGFSKMDQAHLALLLLSHRGSLNKARPLVTEEADWALILALRLAVLLNRRRAGTDAPPVELVSKQGYFQLAVDKHWLKHHPLSETVLENEVAQWRAVGRDFRVKRTVS